MLPLLTKRSNALIGAFLIFLSSFCMPNSANSAETLYDNQSPDQAEKDLNRAVIKRLADQDRTDDTNTITRILDRSRTHATSRCNFFRTVEQTIGHDRGDAANDECLAMLRLIVVESVAGYGELSLAGEHQVGDVYFCKDPGQDGAEECPDPNPSIGPEVKKKEVDLRAAVEDGKGKFADVSDEDRQKVLGAFDRAQADLNAMEGEECSFAFSLRSHAPPNWAIESCEAYQRDWLLWVLSFAAADRHE